MNTEFKKLPRGAKWAKKADGTMYVEWKSQKQPKKSAFAPKYGSTRIVDSTKWK